MNYGQPQNPPPPGYSAPNPQQPGFGGQPSGPQGYYNPFPPEDIEPGKMLAVLSWLVSPLFIIPLIQKDNAFALYHAKQALIFNIFMAILGMVIGVVSAITCGFGSFLAFGIFVFLYPWVMGLIYAIQGEYRPMPWIGHYADQYLGNLIADNRPGAGSGPGQGQVMG